jgi:hexosaminidase
MANQTINLLPLPQRLNVQTGVFAFGDEGLIILDACVPGDLIPAGGQIEKILWKTLQINWDLNASPSVPQTLQKIVLRLAPERVSHSQGYRLHVQSGNICIEGHDPAGVFYGACTLSQLIVQFGKTIPCLEIQDWPDIEARGVMIDISRDKVLRMETLYELIDRLASWKINQIQLYTEHTYAYQNHPIVWKDASPMTGEEILALDRFCRERFIELVPNQNSFGHLTNWLKFEQYAHLAEIIGEFNTPWGKMQGPFSLAPEEPASLDFVLGLYDELLPHFTSRMINIGCDETFDLGAGKSEQACQIKGTGRVYLEFLLKLYANLKKRGFTTQFWGDIILQHPELVGDLPHDMIALEWGYEADHPFEEHGKKFAASGIPFYVCPGTSSWNTLVGKTQNALGNLYNAALCGKEDGAIGYLITDWGDNGHWQSFPVSLLGYAAGAAYSWAVVSNKEINIDEVVGVFGFDDPSAEMGKLAYELGNVYSKSGSNPANSTMLFQLLQMDPEEISVSQDIRGDQLVDVLEAIDHAMEHLKNERMSRPDADLIREEFSLGAHMVRHACQRGLWALKDNRLGIGRSQLGEDMQEILNRYKRVWMRRNRPGGYQDSIQRIKTLIEAYTI